MRVRLLLALVATSAVTLLVAAVALLGPLANRLRGETRSSLQAAVQSARGQLVTGLRKGKPDPYIVARQLHARTNSDGELYDIDPAADPALQGSQLTPQPQPDDQVADVYAAYGQASRKTIVNQTGSEIRITVGLLMPARNGHFYVLTVHKEDTNLTQIVGEIRRAFTKAALVGLIVALGLGFVLSTTLNRRLARLRQAARRIVQEGPDAPAPVDTRRDELGDLARAMAEMQDALRRQEEARRRFVATASHELRTPLTSLMGTLELLAEDLEADDLDASDAKAQVRAARTDLQRLRGLATELLDLSRLDAGVQLRSEPVDLGEVGRAVAAEFALQTTERGTSLEVVPPPGPCWGRGDPDAVARIVRILLDNALRYAPPGSTIAITARYMGEQVGLVVTDDGPGIAPGDGELIFERFRRGESAGIQPGFGLGLAIGRELAARLGGRLDLDDTHTSGARFVLRLATDLPRGGQAASAESDRASYSVDGGLR